jgi:2-polyprenyl-3-methyl-5-hydroxy-6-metoxy-1,4-benzoquinol methylase
MWPKTVRKALRAVANYDPSYYDMYADPNEAWFARLYVERIRRHAEAAGIRPPARLLEAGCQAGRLVVPFARLGFEVTGIDTSGFALRRARRHAGAAGVEATLVQGDLVKVLTTHPQQFDLVVCAEVLYLSPAYRHMLATLARAVRPGGLLCVSHRPQAYYLLEALRQRDLAAAAAVLERREGPLGDSAYYNWQTEEELRELYRSLGLSWIAMSPIDRLAWLSGTGPAQLGEAERQRWLEMELELPAQGSWARYLLVISRPSAVTADGLGEGPR